jgi:hypothetical protein
VASTGSGSTPDAADDDRQPVPTGAVIARDEHRRTASYLYGLIVSGVVLATSSAEERLTFLVVSLVGALSVYWAAETYVHLMAEREHEAHPLNRDTALAIARDGLPLVTVSAVPVAVVLGFGLAGADTATAATFALWVTTLLLFAAGYRIGRTAGLTGVKLLVSVFVSGLLGLVMELLKIGLSH